MTDSAFVMAQGLHQFIVARDNAALGTLILREQTTQDVALQPGQASCRHQGLSEKAQEKGAVEHTGRARSTSEPWLSSPSS